MVIYHLTTFIMCFKSGALYITNIIYTCRHSGINILNWQFWPKCSVFKKKKIKLNLLNSGARLEELSLDKFIFYTLFSKHLSIGLR